MILEVRNRHEARADAPPDKGRARAALESWPRAGAGGKARPCGRIAGTHSYAVHGVCGQGMEIDNECNSPNRAEW